MPPCKAPKGRAKKTTKNTSNPSSIEPPPSNLDSLTVTQSRTEALHQPQAVTDPDDNPFIMQESYNFNSNPANNIDYQPLRQLVQPTLRHSLFAETFPIASGASTASSDHPEQPPGCTSPRNNIYAQTRRAWPIGNRRYEADDVWTWFEEQITGGESRRVCNFCEKARQKNPKFKFSNYAMSTASGVLCSHLIKKHRNEWIEGCEEEDIEITVADGHGITKLPLDMQQHPLFSNEAFLDAVTEWIVSDDQSINAIENVKLRSIFLMLREDLHDSDIPHCSTICNHILQIWEEHLEHLRKDINVKFHWKVLSDN
ncbi:hypothetical protein BDQ17DRAFT_1441694 [Cyathus striatus]|nr:hypothetical protein BDQ17DRAFT_1441694 [Cyathus striatus]